MLGLFMALALAQEGGGAPDGALHGDPEGAVERIVQFESSKNDLGLVVETVERLEETLGREKVAELYVDHVSRASERAVGVLRERVTEISAQKASELFSELRTIYRVAGATSGQRLIRRVERLVTDPRDRIATAFELLAKETQVNGLQRLIADHGGALSQVLRASLRSSGSERNAVRGNALGCADFGCPFLLARFWIRCFDDPRLSTAGTIFLGVASLVALPVALGGDLILFPFQALYWLGGVLHLYSTQSGEPDNDRGLQQVVDRQREELRLQSIELIELREKLRHATEFSRGEHSPWR